MRDFRIAGSFLEHEVTPTAKSGGTPLYDIAASEKLLASCKKHGIAVLGIEGFVLMNRGRYPKMDYIADFSSLVDRDDFMDASIHSAYKFLELAKDEKNILFEFVLTDVES
jgi:hypothetical protein